MNRPLLHPCNVEKEVPHSSFSSSSILCVPCTSSTMKWSGLIQMTHLHLNPHGYYTRHLSAVLSSLINVEYDTNLPISVACFLLLLKIRWVLVLLLSTTYIQYILIILTFLFLFLTPPRSTPPLFQLSILLFLFVFKVTWIQFVVPIYWWMLVYILEHVWTTFKKTNFSFPSSLQLQETLS